MSQPRLQARSSSPARRRTAIDDAVQNAIAKAAKTMRNMHWFQVLETRGQIVDGKVAHWQVTLKIGFTLED